MPRPSSITPAVQALIEKVRMPGMTVNVLHSRIGGILSRRTLQRYLAAHPRAEPATIAERAAVISAGAPPDAPVDAAGALESDDVGRLVRVRDDIDAALGQWRLSMGADGASVRAFAALARIHADVTARLVELRPRPEVERDRLEALGVKARETMLRRAREVAREDESLRARVRRQQDVIDKLLDAGAD